MIFKILLLILSLGAISESFGQMTLQRMFQHVLTKNDIDKPYSSGHVDSGSLSCGAAFK